MFIKTKVSNYQVVYCVSSSDIDRKKLLSLLHKSASVTHSLVIISFQ